MKKPRSLYIILAGFSLAVIWLPVVQQLVQNSGAALRTWLLLSSLASVGIIILFFILYILTKP